MRAAKREGEVLYCEGERMRRKVHEGFGFGMRIWSLISKGFTPDCSAIALLKSLYRRLA